jgi:cytochrome c peroxidase
MKPILGRPRRGHAAAAAIAAVCTALLAGTATAQRQHRSNPAFPPQNHQFGFVNGDLPLDTSNWPHPAAPDANPFPRSTAPAPQLAYREAKRVLGKLLFWDEQLSSGNTMACGTCHDIASGGTDRRDGPGAGGTGGTFGVIRQHLAGGLLKYGFLGATPQTPPSPDIGRLSTPLAAPTMIGAFMFNIQFWDGRSGPALDDGAGGVFGGGIPGQPGPFSDWAGLEDQAHEPPPNVVEMGHEALAWSDGFLQAKINNSRPLALVDLATVPPDLLPAVNSGAAYRRIFDLTFQADPDPAIAAPQGVSRERLAMAIATYERTLVPDQAPIDIPNAMTPQQVAGFNRMRQFGCFGCHSITGTPNGTPLGNQRPLLTATNNLTDPFDNPLTDGDLHDINVVAGDTAKKTPTLRNVGLHQRFFSVGNITTIDALLNFYNGRAAPLGFNNTIPAGSQARLEVQDFLVNALTDPRVANQTFPFDRPQLASERPEFSPFEVNEFGTPTPGPTGTPEIIADSPPLVLKSFPAGATNWFKVGVGNAALNSAAVLLWSNVQGTGPVRWIGTPFFVVAAGSTSAQGIATVNVPFPLDASALGITVFTQWSVNDNGVRSLSDAARFTPFQF